MDVLVVVQRYGEEVAGGAERACRGYAEGLSRRGHHVEVLTTCARSYVDWANAYETGMTDVDGVPVHRLQVSAPRLDRLFSPLNARVVRSDWPRALELQRAWHRMQGPYVPDLPAWVLREHHRFDALVAFTYLYWPTWAALRVATGRIPTVLHPLAHDEPPLGLPFFGEMFRWPSALAFLTPEERDLVQSRFRLAQPHVVAGVGLDAGPPGDATRFRKRFGLGDDPYLLYLGRVDPSKGAVELLSYHETFRRRHESALQLVVVGERVGAVLGDGVVATGWVDEDTKRDALAGCLALAQPSYYESFSIVLIEAWEQGRPAIVQRRCEVLTGQCRRSNGGIPYDGYEQWEAAVELLLEKPHVADALGKSGQRYARDEYPWDTVLDRYETFLDEVTRANSTSAPARR